MSADSTKATNDEPLTNGLFSAIEHRISEAHRHSRCGNPELVCGEWREEARRLHRIVSKLIDAWPNEDIPVEALDGRA